MNEMTNVWGQNNNTENEKTKKKKSTKLPKVPPLSTPTLTLIRTDLSAVLVDERFEVADIWRNQPRVVVGDLLLLCRFADFRGHREVGVVFRLQGRQHHFQLSAWVRILRKSHGERAVLGVVPGRWSDLERNHKWQTDGQPKT